MTTPLYDRHELSKFLSQKMALQAEKAVATMTSMGRGGKWIISDSEYPKFLDLLNDYLFVKGGKAMAFVEQPQYLTWHKNWYSHTKTLCRHLQSIKEFYF
jgi:hypothetical protein